MRLRVRLSVRLRPRLRLTLRLRLRRRLRLRLRPRLRPRIRWTGRAPAIVRLPGRGMRALLVRATARVRTGAGLGSGRG